MIVLLAQRRSLGGAGLIDRVPGELPARRDAKISTVPRAPAVSTHEAFAASTSRSASCLIRRTMVLVEKPGSSATPWSWDCICSRSPPSALISTTDLNLSQSMEPMLEIWVIRSSIFSSVSSKGVEFENRISRTCFMSVSWAYRPRFWCRAFRDAHTAQDVGRFSTSLHSAWEMLCSKKARRESSFSCQV